MHRYMVELGLTPAARSRVQVSSPPGPSKFAGLLGRLRYSDDPAQRCFKGHCNIWSLDMQGSSSTGRARNWWLW